MRIRNPGSGAGPYGDGWNTIEFRDGVYVQHIDNPGASGLPGSVLISRSPMRVTGQPVFVPDVAHIERRFEQMNAELRQAQSQRDSALAEVAALYTICAKVEAEKILSEERADRLARLLVAYRLEHETVDFDFDWNQWGGPLPG